MNSSRSRVQGFKTVADKAAILTTSRRLIPAVWTALRARESGILRNTSPAVNCCCSSTPTRVKKQQQPNKQHRDSHLGSVWGGFGMENIGCRGENFQFATKFHMYKDGARLTSRAKSSTFEWREKKNGEVTCWILTDGNMESNN